MASLYPLEFEPRFRRYLWGGRRLERMLNKPLGAGDDYAESWEVVDHGEDQSVVAHGTLKGATLGQLVRDHGAELFGRHAPRSQFPLLFKYLDAHRNLSVQVHPDDERAALLDPPDLGKTEAWVILHAEPGSKVYAGLKRGFDRDALEREVNRGTTELCLHAFEPQAGDCVFIPAGAIHALGEGLVVAEIQQASDTTFRLYDWNRVGADGQPRPLHVRSALDSINYELGPILPQTPQAMDPPGRERLVACDKFVLDRWSIRGAFRGDVDDRFHIYSVLEGEVGYQGGGREGRLGRGASLLVPACVPSLEWSPAGSLVMLDMYLP